MRNTAVVALAGDEAAAGVVVVVVVAVSSAVARDGAAGNCYHGDRTATLNAVYLALSFFHYCEMARRREKDFDAAADAGFDEAAFDVVAKHDTGDRCLATGDRCLVREDRYLATGDRCLVREDRYLVTGDRCLATGTHDPNETRKDRKTSRDFDFACAETVPAPD